LFHLPPSGPHLAMARALRDRGVGDLAASAV